MSNELLNVPREGASDDSVKLVRWLVAAGTRVERDQPIVEIETSKAVNVLHAHRAGYLHPLAQEGDRVDVGAPLCAIDDSLTAPASAPGDAGAGITITHKALALMRAHGLSEADFAHLSVVRTGDVERVIAEKRGAPQSALPMFLGAPLDPKADWDSVLSAPWKTELAARLRELRRRMKAKFLRHVPLGTLLHDRFELAREYGFGEGTSVYDECLILGDVQLGQHCWVGPFTILDGAHAPLRIGDHSSIGAGSHVYTHDTIERTLSGGRGQPNKRPTTIGRACFISPQCMIGPGTVLGDHSFVAAQSFVQGQFPSHSFLAGNPARRVGRVELRGEHVLLVREE
jgi:acetyltransferase-like isoleucine patch superfamily enzyme